MKTILEVSKTIKAYIARGDIGNAVIELERMTERQQAVIMNTTIYLTTDEQTELDMWPESDQVARVEDIKKGEFVRRIINGKPSAKTYQRGDYCRQSKKYQLIDCDDIYGNGFFVKKGTALHIGFNY